MYKHNLPPPTHNFMQTETVLVGVVARLSQLPSSNQPSKLQNSHKRFTHWYFGELLIFTGDLKLSTSLSLGDKLWGMTPSCWWQTLPNWPHKPPRYSWWTCDCFEWWLPQLHTCVLCMNEIRRTSNDFSRWKYNSLLLSLFNYSCVHAWSYRSILRNNLTYV